MKLILVFRLREGFTEEKIDLEGWVVFYRQKKRDVDVREREGEI